MFFLTTSTKFPIIEAPTIIVNVSKQWVLIKMPIKYKNIFLPFRSKFHASGKSDDNKRLVSDRNVYM